MQETIRVAEKFIVENYNKTIKLKDVADLLHVNPNYFSYLFKQVKGYTFKSYITHLRIEKAKQLLINSFLTVNEISRQVGYDDSNYFSRAFKRVTGLPPSFYNRISEENPDRPKINVETL